MSAAAFAVTHELLLNSIQEAHKTLQWQVCKSAAENTTLISVEHKQMLSIVWNAALPRQDKAGTGRQYC